MDEIRTARLTWRPPDPGDTPALRPLLSDWAVVRRTGSVPWPPDPDDIADRCRPATAGFVGHVFAGGDFVGTCSVKPTGKGPMLGYLIAGAHWGRGFATEVASAVLAHAWDHTDWPWIRATVFHDKPASMRVVAKLGFGLVARGTGTSQARGARTLPVSRYRLVRPVSSQETAAKSCEDFGAP